jgi:hypothetical protein
MLASLEQVQLHRRTPKLDPELAKLSIQRRSASPKGSTGRAGG